MIRDLVLLKLNAVGFAWRGVVQAVRAVGRHGPAGALARAVALDPMLVMYDDRSRVSIRSRSASSAS